MHSMCGFIRDGPSTRCVVRRSLCRERSNGARPPWPLRNGGKKSATACSSTTTRTRRTVRPARPIPCGRSPMLASRALHWHEVPDCEPSDFTGLTIPTRFPEIGDPHEGIDAAAVRSNNCSSLRHETKPRALATRPGRRTFARWRANRAGLPLRVPSPSRNPRTRSPANEDAADSRCELTKQRGRAFGSGKMEATNMPRLRSCSPPMTCWSIRCAADRPAGRGFE